MSKKDDLVSSRPISPSEFLQFPVDEVKDVVGVDGGGDLSSALEHSFSPHPFFVGNGLAFDPFDPFEDFSPPYHNLDSGAGNLKRNNPFQSGFCLGLSGSPEKRQ